MGTGERLACKIVAAALRDKVSWVTLPSISAVYTAHSLHRNKGVDSELVVLDNIVDAAMSAAETTSASNGDQGVAQLGQEFYDQLAVRLGERIRECGGRVPVITGEFLSLCPSSSPRLET